MCFNVTDHGRDNSSRRRKYTVEIDELEAASICLDPLDYAVVSAPVKSLADLFQTWERLAFRYQQQHLAKQEVES